MFLPMWVYDGSDPGLRLFTLANAKLPSWAGPLFEIGCADTDFLARAKAAGAWLVNGGDWRHGWNALVDELPDDSAFVALSTIEHIGLGHYSHDPLDPYGDIKVVQRVRERLPNGGFFYFDVPYAPEGYTVIGTKCRVYDDQALRERFGPHEVLGYTLPSVRGWIEKPARNCEGPVPYYYVACLIRN